MLRGRGSTNALPSTLMEQWKRWLTLRCLQFSITIAVNQSKSYHDHDPLGAFANLNPGSGDGAADHGGRGVAAWMRLPA